MHPRRSQSQFLSLPILIILLPILTLLLLFFTVPPFISFTSQIIRPHAVRKGWDSFNMFLILFAIICGVFAKRNDDGSTTSNSVEESNDVVNTSSQESVSVSREQWYGYSDVKISDDITTAFGVPVTCTSRLKRNSSSYPDLRQESIWETGESSLRFRFFDDFEVNKYSSCPSVPDYLNLNVPKRQSEFKEPDVKEIPVDSYVLRSQPPPPPSSSHPPPPPPPPVSHHKPRRSTTSNKVKKEKVKKNEDHEAEPDKIQTQPPAPPPPPPRPPPRQIPPSPVHMTYQERKSGRRKSNAKKEIKMFVSALYKQRKKKKHQKAKENSHVAHNERDHVRYGRVAQQSPSPSPAPPPPPPPPPPPHSVFHNLFKKATKTKSKKIHSFSPPPPPPPPPPKKTKQSIAPTPPVSEISRKHAYGLPPRPTRVTRKIDEKDDNSSLGSQPPLIPMPPPPPPPPFRVPELKFLVKGDFVKVRSAQSSRCSSPELDENVEALSETSNETNGGSVFCPSPDVNVKADSFIARLRDGWRLEKINSLREKQKVEFALGPENRTISSHF